MAGLNRKDRGDQCRTLGAFERANERQMGRHQGVLQFAKCVQDCRLVAAHHFAAKGVVHRIFTHIRGILADQPGERLTRSEVVVVKAHQHRLLLSVER